jgi:hypothetical protein
MRSYRTTVVLALVGILTFTGLAGAQTERSVPRLPRGDVSWSVGLWAANEDRADTYDDWYRTWNGTVAAGYYWTEHLKTEIDAGLTSEGRLWGTRISPGGVYAPVAHLFSTRNVRLAQQYQFGHNSRFHPHVGVGVAFSWVRHTEEREPGYQTFRVPPYSVIVEPARRIGPVTEMEVVPFIGGGFKGYVSERAFFRSDLTVGLRGGVRNVTFGCGFGVDF